MSLNGLDDAKVTEAYQSALAEAGGWFLLKYASRDAVEILTRGTGGLAEARNAVAQYEDKSPLYGFLLYRRRKVLIKHIPEGTSRLLQARVAVHFQAVAERFTPHDTILSITSADDLSDAALISACALHTAAPSSCSSSGSSRRQKLDGITEDAEEGQADTADETSSLPRPTTAASSSIPTIVEPNGQETTPRWRPEPRTEPKPTALVEPKDPPTPVKSQALEGAKPPVVRAATEPVAELPTLEKLETNNTEYRNNLKHFDSIFENGPDPRLSSQTARPSYQEMYDSYYEHYSKQKVKLGPRPAAATSRPSMDSSKRPRTSGNGARDEARPVSQLPAGLRIATRKSVLDPKRPKSRDSSVVPSIAIPPPPPIPDIPLGSPLHPKSSPASVRSMPATSHKSPGLTPEKQRLMKALELRKKQQKAQKEREARKASVIKEEDSPRTDSPAPALPVKSDLRAPKQEAVQEAEQSRVEKQVVTKTSENAERAPQEVTPKKTIPLPTPDHAKEDSVVDIGGQGEIDDLQSSASASSPTSAQTKASSDATSTRPSSISEEDIPIPNAKPEVHIFSREVNQTPPKSVHSNEERDSIESSPTVVPENVSPVPSVEVTIQHAPQPEVANESAHQDSSPADRKEKLATDEISPSQLKRRSTVEVKEKRRALVEPIQVHLSAEESDAEYLSDDSFMEELQSAKFEEAKPIAVSKSPISPFFPRKSSVSQVTIPERLSSRPAISGRLSSEQAGGERTPSGSWFVRPAEDNMVVAKKINVSSGISQRIKALAEKSNRDSTASVSPTTTPDASTSIVAQRKSSFFTQPPSGSPPSAQSTKRFSRVSVSSFQSPSPNRQSILQSPPTQPSFNTHQPAEKVESVQVTARIIRDPRSQAPNLTAPTENTPLELHQSPIIIDHKKTSVQPPRSQVSPIKVEPASPIPPSSPVSRDAALPRSSSESSWRSIGRRMSESRSGAATIRSQSTNSFESFDEKREDKKDKKDSRTSRLFKRMSSSISSASRKGLGQALSPTLKEEDDELNAVPHREPPPAVQVGDLNVQFPDTLLWKRRWVEIDSTGNLVLSLSKANEQSRGITKRFHLSEFRTPYAPDQDSQELPNSVILDFLDGRTLQCACETYVAQVQVLQILREAHDAWLAYGQI